MRWIFLITIIFLGILLVFSTNTTTSELLLKPVLSQTPIPRPSESVELNYKGITYQVSMIEVSSKETVTLFPNLKDKWTLSEAKEKHNCRAIVNGGFYSKTDTPLGLFRTNGVTVNAAVKSALLNAFLFINPNESVITNQIPDISFATALQSGPLLILNRQQQLLRIHNDESARRMVAAKTATGGLVFLALNDPASTFGGPLLADLPEVLRAWSSQTGTTITDAINLDGGSASGMITDTVNLGELTYVGSYFCVK